MSQSQDETEHICMACGMCCDGTLFIGTPVETSEVEGLVRNGFTLRQASDGSFSFDHPCPAFDVCCRVYDDRPSNCRTYSCKTLDALLAGEIDATEAHARVKTARQSKAKLGTSLQGTSHAEARRQLAESILRDAPLPPYLLPLIGFERILDRYFRHEGQQKLT